MKYLTPLILRQNYYADIEKEIEALFVEQIFAPLMKALKTGEIQNALGDALSRAIAKGQVTYEGGFFSGTFDAAISKQLKKLGARYNFLRKGWTYEGALPAQYQLAIAANIARNNKIVRAVVDTLDILASLSKLREKLNEQQPFTKQYEKTLGKINEEFDKTVRGISIPPKLTEESKRIIAKEWGDNLDLYIVDWSEKAILDLREEVTKNAYAGRRAESLERIIQDKYKSSKAKAKFLARQETSLLMSKYREQKYKEVGVTKYRWEGSNDERERPDHKALNGKVFYFSSPPVTDRKTGARNNPGEDFNCRCIAVPILE